MAKSWRPEGYHAPVPDTSTTENYDIGWCNGHEVGFDDCLGALRKRGFLDMGEDDKLDISGVYDEPIKFKADCFGKLVLIPDEEAKTSYA